MHELSGLEASSADEQVIIGFYNIRLVVFADYADAVRANAGYRSGLKSNIWKSESRIAVIRDDDTLTPRIIFVG